MNLRITYYIVVSAAFCILIHFTYFRAVVLVDTFVLFRYEKPHRHI